MMNSYPSDQFELNSAFTGVPDSYHIIGHHRASHDNVNSRAMAGRRICDANKAVRHIRIRRKSQTASSSSNYDRIVFHQCHGRFSVGHRARLADVA